MSTTRIEHVNLTVRSPDHTAEILCRLFGWQIRWQGPSPMGGYTVHVGNEDTYLSLYAPPDGQEPPGEHATAAPGFNHLGVVVTGLDEVEGRVRAEGFPCFNHDDYDPGRRFYFTDGDGIEYEVVEYE
jgi:catechol 2,3-dioxygenase-like lactoylglutathione lyase family enzyme